MSFFSNKRILLFAPRFFGYENEIKRRLGELGASIDFYDQRPSNSVLAKTLIRINKRFLARKINQYYTDIIARLKDTKYDFVLFISPEAITSDAFKNLKKVHSESRFILYMWDSLRNKKSNIEDLLPLFDDRFSFDKRDCEASGSQVSYRPLFFLNEYAAMSQAKSRKFDLLFIGTIHSDRHKILMQCKAFCNANKLSYFYYMFLPTRLLYYYRSIGDSSIRGAGSRAFQYQPLSKASVLELMEQSKVVLDIEHPKQSGLTIRTIEVLGAKRKLITTNADVKNYDFYHPQNICVIDRNNLKLDPQFFETPVVDVPEDVYWKYSIDGWLGDIFRADQSIAGHKSPAQ